MNYLVQLLFKLATWPITMAPRRVQLFLGGCIGILWFDVLRIRRKVVLDNLSIAFPNWSLSKKIQIGRRSLINLGCTIIEICIMRHYDNKYFDYYFECEGFEHLRNAYSKNQGVLCLSLHLGNGDFALTGFGHSGFEMSLISKHFKSKWLDEFWFRVREKQGIQFINHEKSSFDILRALKKNRAVVFVIDQFMGPPVGCRTRFFGKEAGTAMGLAIFAQKSGAPVVPIYTYRKPNGKTVVCVDRELKLSPEQSESVESMTQAYTNVVEELVRKHPEQWMWVHKRWKPFKD